MRDRTVTERSLHDRCCWSELLQVFHDLAGKLIAFRTLAAGATGDVQNVRHRI
jgi:hypothetical protein